VDFVDEMVDELCFNFVSTSALIYVV